MRLDQLVDKTVVLDFIAFISMVSLSLLTISLLVFKFLLCNIITIVVNSYVIKLTL